MCALPLLRTARAVVFFATVAHGLNNGMLRTPVMGFSDACLGGGESTRLNATQLRAVAASFVSTGLAALGYTAMNLDDSWELFNRSDAGALLPDPAKFPQGMRPLRDWLHARNLTLGLYTSDAERSCKKTAGSLYHESADAATLALEFGIDFIKVDPAFGVRKPCGVGRCSVESQEFNEQFDLETTRRTTCLDLF